MSSPVLCRLAARAARLFSATAAAHTSSAPPASPSPASSSLGVANMTHLVSCTRSLVTLTRTSGTSATDTRLLQCVRECADATLETFASVAPAADVPVDVCVVALVILRDSTAFWPEERCASLARHLAMHLDATTLSALRPRVVIAIVHAIAKACPSQAHLPILADCIAQLLHCEAQLAAHDVATLLWCMATLQLAESQRQFWSALCTRATLLYPRMGAVSRLSITQALLLLRTPHLCESQAELLRVAYATSREPSATPPLDEGQREHGRRRPARGLSRTGGDERAARSSSTTPTAAGDADGAQAALLQQCTHALSDDALVRLFLTLLEQGARPTAELRLVVAHLTLRAPLSVPLSLQLLHYTQSRCTPAAPAASPTPPFDAADAAAPLRTVRQHAVQQLLGHVKAGATGHLRQVVSVLCVEHSSWQGTDVSGSGSGGAEPIGGALWTAIQRLLSDPSGTPARALELSNGEQLWCWHCIAVYVRSVSAEAEKTCSDAPVPAEAASSAAVSPDGALGALEQQLRSCTDPTRCWPAMRERQTRCAEVVVAAATRGTAAELLLRSPSVARSALGPAMALLDGCVRTLLEAPAALPAFTTLRLLSAVEEAPAVAAAHVQPLRDALVAQLERHATHSSGMLQEVTRYLAGTLAPLHTAWPPQSHLRVSDAVLDVYVRLLTQEHHRVLPATQAALLLRCFEERRGSPSALENAFMMLLTRRFGQTAPLLTTVPLSTATLGALVALAGALPRRSAASTTSAAATATMIISSLLDRLIYHAIPACATAEELVAGAVVLGDDAVAEVLRTAALAAAVQARAASLLQSAGDTWTPIQKAYLVAALVCVAVDPSAALLQALRGANSAPGSATATPPPVP
ncbi:hypothetical protein NESM_000291300 [Novymonas esmeraldas]|uniref:Uncharacterized protein n=1 Tax=Novymonas esmeraldas TaxID=1808958 RepID=A0AAW0F6P4_9TRYP